MNDLWLANTFAGLYPLPAGYAELSPKALSGTVFPVKLIIGILVTTVTWVLTTYLTRPESKDTLRSFYRLTRPGGPGWKKVVEDARADGDMIDEADRGIPWEMPAQVLMVFVGCVSIYASLFSIGNYLYGRPLTGTAMALVAAGGTYALFRLFGRLRAN